MKSEFDELKVNGMNYYGFVIKSNTRTMSSDYLVFAESKMVARGLIQNELNELVKEKDGWLWGTPVVEEIENIKELKTANIIWQ